MGPCLSGEGAKLAGTAHPAARAGFSGLDLGSLPAPEVEGEQRTAHSASLTGEELEGLGCGERGGEVHGSAQNAGSLAGFHVAAGGCGEEAGKAGCGLRAAGPGRLLADRRRLREDVHGGGVGAHGGGVDPGGPALDAEVVKQIAGFKVVCAVQHDVRSPQQGGGVCRYQIRDVRLDGDIAINCEKVLPGRLRFGKRMERVLFGKEHLALQVGGFDKIPVDEGKAAYAGACK